VAGTVAKTHQSIHLENYRQHWHGIPDLPLAQETFGSVICVPLIYGGDAIGTLMVIAGIQGRTFQREHVHLLELLGAQAAVAIAHSRLFAEQHKLTEQVEAARSQLETVLISTENPVIAVDRHFKLILANPASRELFSIHETATGHSINDLLPSSALPPDYRHALRDLRRNRVHIYEISFDEKVYLCHVAQLGRPRTAGWVAVLNDVTQLKELDRLKSEMIRMTSHDLKNPLQAAMAHLELLNEDLAEIKQIDAQETVATIQKQLERMNRIIGGILDLERLKTGTPSLELCSPAKLIEHTAEELHQLADDHNIILETQVKDSNRKFLGDPPQFQRALINLVENAIKFTPPGGRVNINIKDGIENNDIIFQIEDTGIGIPDHLHSQIFDRFFRGGQRGQKGAEHVSGSGLGLSLVKTIIENHHGKIWLRSNEGTGTSFFIAVPATEEPTPNTN
jgi:signal transduction histidine kinase